jgi:mannose-6-phosphate isomerase
VAIALVMRHLVLADGDAVVLRPGVVHAYLEGRAIEVMASSDNVMRAAFTTKRVDVEAFVRTAVCDGPGAEWAAMAAAPAADGVLPLARLPFGVARHPTAGEVTATHDAEIVLCVPRRPGRGTGTRATHGEGDAGRAAADAMRPGEVRLLAHGERAMLWPGAGAVRVWAA